MPNFEIMQEGNYGGDAEERRAWPELRPIFPHYETLWRALIVPLTERPQRIGLRSDLPTKWLRFAENHYSICLHLATAMHRAKQCREQSLAFEEVFSHLGTTLDIVEDFLFTCDWIIQGKERPMDVATTEDLVKACTAWVNGDGGKGTNGDGIFFFTTEGAYAEWHGDYMVSDFPLKLSTPPELVRNVS